MRARGNVQLNDTGELRESPRPRKFLRGSQFICREIIVGGESSTMRRPPDGGMQVPLASVPSEGVSRLIDLVSWSLLAALLPIVLHVCVRILSLVYWSFFAPFFSFVFRGREIPVLLPKERRKKWIPSQK